MSYQDEVRKLQILRAQFSSAEDYYAQLQHQFLAGNGNISRARVDRARQNVEEIKARGMRQKQIIARMAPQSVVRSVF